MTPKLFIRSPVAWSGLLTLVVACGSLAPGRGEVARTGLASGPNASAEQTAPAYSSPTREPIHYVITQGGQAAHWTVLVGIEQGFFRQQGLDLDITYTNSITDSMNVLVSGSADLTGGGPNPLVPIVERGAPVVAVASLDDLMTYSFVLAPGLRSYDDVRGKLLAVSGPTTPDTWLGERLLARAGLTRGVDYEVLTTAAPHARVAALRAGQAAAALFPQPSDLQVEAEGMQRIGFTQDAIELAWSLLLTRRDWAAANRSTLLRFLVALRDAGRWLYEPENRATAVAILAQYSSMPPEFADGTYEIKVARFEAISRDGRIDHQRFENWYELFLQTGVLTLPTPPINKYIDESYWHEAAQRS